MVNSSLNNNAKLGNSVAGSSTNHKKSTLPVAVKKVPLRDVQNDNRIFMSNYPGSPPCHQITSICGASDHLVHGGAARKLDSELGKQSVQGVTEQNTYGLNFKRYRSQKQPDPPKERSKKKEHETSSIPAFAPAPLASPIKFSPGKPPVPNFLGMPRNGLPAAHSRHLISTPESVVPQLLDSERSHDEQKTERLLYLQNLLKHFDETDQSEYIKTLRCLPPSGLSRHAVELEKRSMQLSVEEAKEIQRMRALNIFGNLQ